MSNIPTPEQVAAIEGFATGENLVIDAAAGSGKTSTLRMMADVHPSKRGLYLAFNKAIAVEASQKFAGTNVKASTAHALAYGEFGRPMQGKLQKGQRMRSGDRAEALGLRSALMAQGASPYIQTRITKNVATRLIGETITNYCRSQGTEITADMVSIPLGLMLDEEQEADARAQIIVYARKYWLDVLDPNGVLPFTHDHYLKMWSLSNPRLDYDYILFDEAQDADEQITGVVKAQKGAQIVAVGDANQAIYGWRGATDSMHAFGGQRFQLSQSFRFGEAIADEANVWLDLLHADIRVRGSDKPSSVHETKNGRVPEAVLTRSNAGGIAEVIRAHESGVSVAIAGKGKAEQMLKLAEAAKSLQEKHYTYHPELDMFKSWSEVQDFVDEEETSDLKPFVKLIDSHGPDFLMRAINKCVPEAEARTVISTAHVAKGLEWTAVRIAEDFRGPGKDEDGNQKPLERAEAMLAYVAVTRAQRHLDNTGLAWIHTFTGGLAEITAAAAAKTAKRALENAA
jgi:hypothetical protein